MICKTCSGFGDTLHTYDSPQNEIGYETAREICYACRGTGLQKAVTPLSLSKEQLSKALAAAIREVEKIWTRARK